MKGWVVNVREAKVSEAYTYFEFSTILLHSLKFLVISGKKEGIDMDTLEYMDT